MRNISPEIFTDEFFGQLPMEYRLLWIGLLTSIADDQGRMLDNAALIKAQVFPYDPYVSIEIIEAGLTLYSEKHKIHRYVAGGNGSGRRLIQVVNWWRYQKSTQWAARSIYPAPAKWVDRIRTHEHGSGQQPVTFNWDQPGGFVLSMKRLRSNYVVKALPLQIREDEVKEEEEVKRRKKDKNLPTPLPPSSKSVGKAEGGRKVENVQELWKDLKPKQRKAAEHIAAILRSAGLSGIKIETLIYQVAIRNLPDPRAYTLAALASAYADPSANRKSSVAASRMERDMVDPAYQDPETWVKLPKNILKAAGIDDINVLMQETKAGRMQEMIKQLRGEQ